MIEEQPPSSAPRNGPEHELRRLRTAVESARLQILQMRAEVADPAAQEALRQIEHVLAEATAERGPSAPTAPVEPPPRRPATMPAPHPQPALHGRRPLRILIADDHAIFRDGLVGLITQDAGMHVVGEAADGVEAVELARELQPDVLIVDISMPKMNGLEVTRILAREMPQLKIVGLSMHERQDMARAMRAAGAEIYLTKTGPWEDLMTVLRQWSPAG